LISFTTPAPVSVTPPNTGGPTAAPGGPPGLLSDLNWTVPVLLTIACLFFVAAIIIAFVWCFRTHPDISKDYHMCKSCFGVCSGILFFAVAGGTIVITALFLSQPGIFLNSPTPQIFANYDFFWQFGIGVVGGMVLFFTCMITCFKACCCPSTCPNPTKRRSKSPRAQRAPPRGEYNNTPGRDAPRQQPSGNNGAGNAEKKLADDEVVFMPIVRLDGNPVRPCPQSDQLC